MLKDKALPRGWLSWATIGLLAVLCGLLALLQNRWIGEVSRAERERLQQQLQSELTHLSREFNNEITTACAGLFPSGMQIEELGREKAYAQRYLQWKESHDRVFSRIALAAPQDGSLVLLNLDLDTAQFSPADWPSTWSDMRDQLRARLNGSGPFEPRMSRNPMLIDLPRFGGPRDWNEAARLWFRNEPGPPRDRKGPGPLQLRNEPVPPRDRNQPGPPRFREQEWLLVELNLDYIRGTLLPELLQRHLGGRGKLEYQAEVVSNADPSQVIFQSTPGPNGRVLGAPDASVNLFEIFYPRMQFRDRLRGRFPPGIPTPDNGGRGRWRMLVRHQAGSLEAVVSRARWHNIALSAGILLLILTTVTALVRYSRRAHQLAELQVNFVTGVSHELRTPLTVIRTAAFNLRGRLAAKPDQVERYGKLIQEESEKLTALVEQVLQFASAKAGHVIRTREPVAIGNLIDEGLRSSRVSSNGSHVVVEKQVDAGLPLVLADELAMKLVLQNLLDNAVKYGTEGSNWIGVFASAPPGEEGTVVEVRVADRGPGSPLEEQEHIFEPFFRGRRAVRDQVHGTGLGLNLVKKIVEAHGGAIRVHSEPMKGTEFVIRIPVAPPELQDEFAHSVG